MDELQTQVDELMAAVRAETADVEPEPPTTLYQRYGALRATHLGFVAIDPGLENAKMAHADTLIARRMAELVPDEPPKLSRSQRRAAAKGEQLPSVIGRSYAVGADADQ